MKKIHWAGLGIAALATLAPLAASAGGISVAVSTPDFGFLIGAPVYGPRVIAAPVVVPAPVILAPPVVVPARVIVPRHRFIRAPVVVAPPVVVPRRGWAHGPAPRAVYAPAVAPRHGWTPPPRVVYVRKD